MGLVVTCNKIKLQQFFYENYSVLIWVCFIRQLGTGRFSEHAYFYSLILTISVLFLSDLDLLFYQLGTEKFNEHAHFIQSDLKNIFPNFI